MKKTPATNGDHPLALPLTPIESATPETSGLKAWALVELYGHQRIVGHVTSDPVEMPGMLRVDVPDLLNDGAVVRKGHTRYFGKGALYSVTPCDEATVRNLLPHVDGLPARQASFGTYREEF